MTNITHQLTPRDIAVVILLILIVIGFILATIEGSRRQ